MLVQCPREEPVRRVVDQRRHELHVGRLPAHPARGARQRLRKAPQLAHSTAGEERHGPGLGVEAQPLPGRVPAGAHGDLVGKRMPHEPYRNGPFLVERGLERKQREHHVHRPRDLRKPVAAPCPDRRTDEVDRLHAGAAQRELQREVEVRSIHADERIGWILGESPGQAPPDRNELQIAPDRLGQPHDRQALHRIQGLAAEGLHARTRNALEPRPRHPCANRFDQPAREHVSGRLAGDDGESQGPSPSPPPLIARFPARKTSRNRESRSLPRTPSPARRAARARNPA